MRVAVVMATAGRDSSPFVTPSGYLLSTADEMRFEGLPLQPVAGALNYLTQPTTGSVQFDPRGFPDLNLVFDRGRWPT
jgi:hypothetical protein